MSAVRLPRVTARRSLAALVGLVVVGELSIAGLQLAKLHTDSEHSGERAQVVHAVRAEVLALTDIGATTTDKEIAGLLAGMTGHLKDQFSPQVDAFRQAMVQNKVHSRGRVIAVGVTSMSAGRASAVVAAAAQVSNSRTSGDEERIYRLELRLLKVGNRCLVDSLDFVS